MRSGSAFALMWVAALVALPVSVRAESCTSSGDPDATAAFYEALDKLPDDAKFSGSPYYHASHTTRGLLWDLRGWELTEGSPAEKNLFLNERWLPFFERDECSQAFVLAVAYAREDVTGPEMLVEMERGLEFLEALPASRHMRNGVMFCYDIAPALYLRCNGNTPCELADTVMDDLHGLHASGENVERVLSSVPGRMRSDVSAHYEPTRVNGETVKRARLDLDVSILATAPAAHWEANRSLSAILAMGSVLPAIAADGECSGLDLDAIDESGDEVSVRLSLEHKLSARLVMNDQSVEEDDRYRFEIQSLQVRFDTKVRQLLLGWWANNYDDCIRPGSSLEIRGVRVPTVSWGSIVFIDTASNVSLDLHGLALHSFQASYPRVARDGAHTGRLEWEVASEIDDAVERLFYQQMPGVPPEWLNRAAAKPVPPGYAENRDATVRSE